LNVKVIRNFPDVTDFNYNYRQWNRQFLEQNVILNGRFSYLYYPVHWTTLSLKFAFGGSEYYIMDKMRYGVNDCSYLILNRDSVYESLIDSERPVETLTLNFTSEFADEVFYSSFNNDDFLTDYPEIRDRVPVNFFQKLYPNDRVIMKPVNHLRAAVKESCYDSNSLNEKLHCLLGYVFKTQLTESRQADLLKSKKRSTRYELYKRLNIAKDYIRSNYGEKIELKRLALIACLSPHHLLRQFRLSFNVTPHQFLTQVRLERARELLITTGIPITQICIEVGFESLSSFGVLFKKHFLQSPENYRFTFAKKSIFKQ
jgi:AraC family transcriptional regulator